MNTLSAQKIESHLEEARRNFPNQQQFLVASALMQACHEARQASLESHADPAANLAANGTIERLNTLVSRTFGLAVTGGDTPAF